MGLSEGIVKEATKRLGLPADLPADLDKRLRAILNDVLDQREIEIDHPLLTQPVRVTFPRKDKGA